VKIKKVTRAGAVSVLAAGAVVATGFVGVAPASASTHNLHLNYTCDYPLLGMQDIAVDMAAEIPDTLPVNTPSDRFAITATTVIPASTTEGLYSLKAATIEGGAIADATVNAPEGPVVATARPTIAKTNVPESGPFTVVATGSTPSLGFQQEGWATVNVGNIRLVVTPKDAAGNATALGTLQVQCYQKPGQVNALAQFYIGTTPTPKPSAANITTAQKDNYATKTLTSRKSSVDLLYDCQNLPIVLTQRFKVKATLDYPAEIPVNTYAPRIKIDSLTTINENTTEASTRSRRPRSTARPSRSPP